ncbi:MAG: hypothetical protein ABI705_12980 [Aestuariivirga sp.]
MPVPATSATGDADVAEYSLPIRRRVSFNNLIKDCMVKEPFGVDYAKYAESMCALALDWAKTTGRTTVITIVSDAFTWATGACCGTLACRR